MGVNRTVSPDALPDVLRGDLARMVMDRHAFTRVMWRNICFDPDAIDTPHVTIYCDVCQSNWCIRCPAYQPCRGRPLWPVNKGQRP